MNTHMPQNVANNLIFNNIGTMLGDVAAKSVTGVSVPNIHESISSHSKSFFCALRSMVGCMRLPSGRPFLVDGNANFVQPATLFCLASDGGSSQNIHETNTMTDLTIGSTSIRQLDGLYNLNDLHKASNGEERHLPNRFVRNAQTKELIEEISKTPNLAFKSPIKTQRGLNGGTFACRELVYAYAMWISPKFHLAVIRAFDQLQHPAPATQPSLPMASNIPDVQYHINIIRPGQPVEAHALSATLLMEMGQSFPELAVVLRKDLDDAVTHTAQAHAAMMKMVGFARGIA